MHLALVMPGPTACVDAASVLLFRDLCIAKYKCELDLMLEASDPNRGIFTERSFKRQAKYVSELLHDLLLSIL